MLVYQRVMGWFVAALQQTQQTPVIWVSGALCKVVPRSQPGSILSEAGFYNWDN